MTTPARMRGGGERAEVEQLPGGVDHGGQDGELDARVFGERAQDGLFVEQAVRAGRDEGQVIGGVESASAQVAGDGVEVGRKLVGEGQDFRAVVVAAGS